MLIPTFIFIAGAVSRLAWFNISTNEGYQGLPTPISSATLMVIMLLDFFAYGLNQQPCWFNYFMKYFIIVVPFILAWLNVTDKLEFGASIRKKKGTVTYIVIFCGSFTILLFILAAINWTGMALFIFLGILGFFIMILVFIILGFVGGKKGINNGSKPEEKK